MDKIARVWNTETGELLCAYGKHADWITRACFSPDGKVTMTVDHQGLLRVWDATTGEDRQVIKHPAPVWGLAVTPDGSHVLTGTGGSLQSSLKVLKIGPSPESVLRIWEAATGKLVRELKGHEQTVYTIDVSPDGRLAVSGDWDGMMRLWDLATGRELSKTRRGEGRVPFVTFSPDGKLIVAGGGGRRVDGQIVEFPNEQVRVYQVVDTASRDGDL